MRKIFTAAMLAAMFSMALPSVARAGWIHDGREWRLEEGGSSVRSAWSLYGGKWYYLKSDGYMARNALVPWKGETYFVGSDGAMASSQWKSIGSSWMWFGQDGRAARQSGSYRKPVTVNGAKYVFDAGGNMLSGWMDEDYNAIGMDGWEDGAYYFGTNDTGWMLTGWQELDTPGCWCESCSGRHWFYFDPSTGRKVAGKSRSIDGKQYSFDSDGRMLQSFQGSGSGSVSYFGEDGAKHRSEWFFAIPSEDMDPDAYYDGDGRWFYANSDGSIKKSVLATVRGCRAGFDDSGCAFYGLRFLKIGADNAVLDFSDPVTEWSDLLSWEKKEGYSPYYFGDMDSHEMRKGTAYVDIDGSRVQYRFGSDGVGLDGIVDGKLYRKGRVLKAEDGSKYAAYTADGSRGSIGAFLVDSSGRVQCGKQNLKDSDGYYYATDASGIILSKSSSSS